MKSQLTTVAMAFVVLACGGSTTEAGDSTDEFAGTGDLVNADVLSEMVTPPDRGAYDDVVSSEEGETQTDASMDYERPGQGDAAGTSDGTECMPKTSLECVGSELHWFDSCGNQGQWVASCGSLPCFQGACCTPKCTGKDCGNDGCGGNCGSCSDGKVCGASGACECQPETHQTCLNGNMVWVDSCGMTGELATPCPFGCIPSGCLGCEPNCTNHECGDDGCGGSCGSCPGAQDACVAGACKCQPGCAGKECGSDGCSGSCGSCLGQMVCNTQNRCQLPGTRLVALCRAGTTTDPVLGTIYEFSKATCIEGDSDFFGWYDQLLDINCRFPAEGSTDRCFPLLDVPEIPDPAFPAAKTQPLVQPYYPFSVGTGDLSDGPCASGTPCFEGFPVPIFAINRPAFTYLTRLGPPRYARALKKWWVLLTSPGTVQQYPHATADKLYVYAFVGGIGIPGETFTCTDRYDFGSITDGCSGGITPDATTGACMYTNSGGVTFYFLYVVPESNDAVSEGAFADLADKPSL